MSSIKSFLRLRLIALLQGVASWALDDPRDKLEFYEAFVRFGQRIMYKRTLHEGIVLPVESSPLSSEE